MFMPKVLHIGPCDSPGGMANVMRILAEHPPEGWDAELLASHVVGSPWAKWRAYRKARATLKSMLSNPEQRPEVVHLHTAADWSWWRKRRFALLAHASGCKVVVHIHSGKFDTWLGSVNSSKTKQMQTDLNSTSATTVVLSDHWARTFSEHFERLHVIGNPISPTLQCSVDQRDTNHMLLLGRNDSVKGHDFAIMITKILREKRPQLRLSMTGVDHCSEPGVEALGWVSEEEKNRLLQSCSVLLVPSLFEGQPLVVMEALASGLPVLASDSVHSVPDSVVHATYQDLEDWVAKLEVLLQEKVNSVALSKSVSHHHISNVNMQWRALYDGLPG